MSNIIKFQLQSQFQSFLCVFTKKNVKHSFCRRGDVPGMGLGVLILGSTMIFPNMVTWHIKLNGDGK